MLKGILLVISFSSAIMISAAQADSSANKYSYEEIISYCNDRIQKYPSDIDCYKARAEARYFKKEYQLAIADYLIAIEIDPTDPLLFYNLGIIYLEATQYDKAVESTSISIELDSSFAKSYLARGKSMFELKKYQNSVADFRYAKALEPDNDEVYYNLGVSFLKLQQFDEAIINFSVAMEKNSDQVGYRYWRGVAKFRRGLYKEALDDLLFCEKIIPNDPLVYKFLGLVYLKLDNNVKACLNFSRSNELGENVKDFLKNCEGQ